MSKQEMLAQFIVQEVVALIAEDEGVEFDQARGQFYASHTFEVLYDFETHLYREGAGYVWALWQSEPALARTCS